MAHHKSAKKRIRQDAKKRLRNRHIRSTLRTAIKNITQKIEEKDAEGSKELLTKTTSIIDKAVTKGVIHKNNAARRISRLTRKVNALVAASSKS